MSRGSKRDHAAYRERLEERERARLQYEASQEPWSRAVRYHADRLEASLARTDALLADMSAQHEADAAFIARWNAATVAEAITMVREERA